MFACLYIPDFAVAAVLRAAEETVRERAVAVLEGDPPLLTVAAVNDRARALGAHAGMTRLQAESCAGLLLRRRSRLQEEAAQAALLDVAGAFSPRVEATAAGTVTLDLAGLEPLFGPPARIARDLARRAAEAGLEAHVAVAPDPDSARIAARGFPGVTVLTAETVAARLGLLPVEALAPAPALLETLERWGVRTLRALAALPSPSLVQRLGQEGSRLQRLARGEERRPLVPAAACERFEECFELEDPLDLLEPLAFLLNRMLEHLCTRLAARALAAQRLRLTLHLEPPRDVPLDRAPGREAGAPQEVFTRILPLPVPLLDARVFLKLLQLDLQAHPPGAPVRKVRLAAEAAPPRPAQPGLFLPLAPQPERLELTLARLRGLVGEDAAGSPQLLDSHHPDAFRLRVFGEVRPAPVCARPGVSALRMIRPPQPVRVELSGAAPVRLWLRGESASILALSGPWRSSGAWWSEQPWEREEWDVAVLREGQAWFYRLVHDRVTREWRLEGTYD
jgi:protein ImuB